MDAAMSTQTSSLESSPRLAPIDAVKIEDNSSEIDSGYASASSSTVSLPQITLNKAHLRHLNEQLEGKDAMDILRFCLIMFPGLYQSTAFGLSGLATIDMLSRIQEEQSSAAKGVGLIFLDTLFHFPETYALVDRVRQRYPGTKVHVFRPDGADSVAEFEERYGEKLYEMSEELYDWIAKVEPLQRAYAELRVAAVLTGRRRSQGGARNSIPVIELDEERGIVKINPLASWSFAEVREYIRAHDVPYNELLDRGYKSIGDWHSTSPVGEGEDERAGRWKGQQKTECGIHNKQSRYAQFLQEADRKTREDREQQQLAAASVVLQHVEQQQELKQSDEAIVSSDFGHVEAPTISATEQAVPSSTVEVLTSNAPA